MDELYETHLGGAFVVALISAVTGYTHKPEVRRSAPSFRLGGVGFVRRR